LLDIPQFSKLGVLERDLKDNKHNSLHLGQKYARIFVLGHYLFLVAHSYSEQIMSADKYPSIFSPQMELIVYIFSTWGWRNKEVTDEGGVIVQKGVTLQ